MSVRKDIRMHNELARFVEAECKRRKVTASQYINGVIIEQFGLPLEWLSTRKPREIAQKTGMSLEAWEAAEIERISDRINKSSKEFDAKPRADQLRELIAYAEIPGNDIANKLPEWRKELDDLFEKEGLALPE